MREFERGNGIGHVAWWCWEKEEDADDEVDWC